MIRTPPPCSRTTTNTKQANPRIGPKSSSCITSWLRPKAKRHRLERDPEPARLHIQELLSWLIPTLVFAASIGSSLDGASLLAAVVFHCTNSEINRGLRTQGALRSLFHQRLQSNIDVMVTFYVTEYDAKARNDARLTQFAQNVLYCCNNKIKGYCARLSAETTGSDLQTTRQVIGCWSQDHPAGSSRSLFNRNWKW